MEENNIENLVRTAPFIDKTLKEECSDYLKKQVPKGLDHQIYSLKVFESPYQGDIINNFDLVFFQLIDDYQQTQFIENSYCMLLSHTCDINVQDKSSKSYISLVPVTDYNDFAEKRFDGYSEQQWQDFLRSVRENKITNLLYLPDNPPQFKASVVFLDQICSVDPYLLDEALSSKRSQRIASLSHVGFYYFLIKLTYHFARFDESRSK
ncbi:MAG: hypothetical protein KBH86_10210 [Syntrophorhabdus sp.]|nr:hypothetical protein [Syntrophorhabdus sp.]